MRKGWRTVVRRGVLVGGGLHVVKADDGDVLGDAEAGLTQGADRADGGDVVEGEESGEVFAGGEELACGGVAGIVGWDIAFKAADVLRRDAQAGCGHGVADGVPACVGGRS